MNIKEILIKAGVSSELVDTIADTIKAEIPKEFVSKAQYSKKVNQIDELNNTIADLEAKAGNNGELEDIKKQLTEKEQEFETYKQGIETEKANGTKTKLLEDLFKSNGGEKHLKVLLGLANGKLSDLEIEEDKIKDSDKFLEGFKSEYGEYFTQTGVEGDGVTQPPTTGQQSQGNSLADALGNLLN